VHTIEKVTKYLYPGKQMSKQWIQTKWLRFGKLRTHKLQRDQANKHNAVVSSTPGKIIHSAMGGGISLLLGRYGEPNSSLEDEVYDQQFWTNLDQCNHTVI